jgi:predicted metal-dependent hydrolase
MPFRKVRPRKLLGEGQVKLQGRTVPYALKQSERIRGIRMEIRLDSGLTVIVPKRFKQEQVQQILEQKAGWILKHLPAGKPVQMPLFSKEVDHGERVPYMGQSLKLTISRDHAKTVAVELKDHSLHVHLNGRQTSVAALLEKWYRQQAELVFSQKADKFSEMMGLRYSSIIIRGQRTRWGSCSPGGSLSLNWKLMLAPETIVDYVIMHELAHIKHMNHSRRFWEFLARYCPDWQKYRNWLSTHEGELKTSASFGLS